MVRAVSTSSVDHVGGRVQRLREAAGLSVQALADITGLTLWQLRRIEMGDRKRLSAGELYALAVGLGVSQDHLLGAVPSAVRFTTLAARLTAGRPADGDGLREAMQRAATLVDAASRFRAFDFDSRPIDRWWMPPELPKEKDRGTALAVQVREHLGLGTDPITDIQLFTQLHFGLQVAREPLEGMRGVTFAGSADDGDARVAIALVNNANEPIGAQRFTAAHELGHFLFGDLDRDWIHVEAISEGSGLNLTELRCNTFAAELLCPAAGVREILDATAERGREGLRAAAVRVWSTYAVSWKVAQNRVLDVSGDLDNASWLHRQKLAASLDAEGIDPEVSQDLESEATGVHPPSLTVASALRAYAAGEVSAVGLAELFRYDDAETLRQDLERAGWMPRASMNA